MRRYLIHLAVALFAFAVGVTAASLFGFASGTRTMRHGGRSVYVEPLMPAEHPNCRMRRFRAFPVAPVAPVEPVAPETPKPLKETHIRIRRADGSIQVIEVQTGNDAKQ